MEHRFLNFEIKNDNSESDDGSFTAYASVFGNSDSHRDVVVSGAFQKSLGSGRKVRMLWQHDQNTPIGVWDEIREDDHGLFVKGRYANTPKAQEIRELIRVGAVDSLSIGYRTVDYEYTNSGDRLLKEVELYEISIVTIPSNKESVIIQSKSANDETESKAIFDLLSKRTELISNLLLQ